MPGIQLISQGFVLLCLVTMLVLVDPVAALAASVVVGGAYGIILILSRKLVRRLGEMADPDLVLHVEVVGIAPDTLEIDALEVQRAAAPSFLHVRVIDRSVSDVGAGPELPRDTVAGKFIEDLASRIRAAEAKGDAAAAEQGRQVLRLGRRLLLDDPDRVTLA